MQVVHCSIEAGSRIKKNKKKKRFPRFTAELILIIFVFTTMDANKRFKELHKIYKTDELFTVCHMQFSLWYIY